MIKSKHITNAQVNQLVGGELCVKLWFNGLMNEIRRYPNEIPCDFNEIPSMIIPFASGEEKVEWGFTAGMSCLSLGPDNSVIIKNAEHFPACTMLALLSLLYDSGITQGKDIELKLRYADSAELKPFLNLLDEAERKLTHVTIRRDGTLPKENRPAQSVRSIFPIGNSVCVVRKLHQIDIGRFCAEVRCIDGSISVRDDITITDGNWKVLQEHCPVTLITSLNNKNVSCSDDLSEDDFAVSFAMWFPADTPAFDGMALIREEQPPQFTPRPMPSRIELYPVKKESGLLSRLKGMFKKSKEDSVTAIADTKIDTSASKTADTKTDTNASKVAAVQAKPNTFNQDKAQPIQKTEKSAPQVSCPVSQPLEVSPDDERLMLSQLVALFHKTGHDGYRNRYINELTKMGFTNEQAETLFKVEHTIIQRHCKDYLTSPDFTKVWFMGLRQPFLLRYPKTKEDIQKERFFTISEICKFIDEAEWHYWNSHERDLPEDVFEEIYDWRLRGKGGDSTIEYCEAIAKETGIPMDLFGKYINREGSHLNKYKWSSR
ncbi:MAG: hypothetical protein IKF49_04360 [Clostridia bacterium]|nr:hypothetical protein [Clostridia bacterium]